MSWQWPLALTLAAVVIIATITAIYVVVTTAAAASFADEADETDPDATIWLAALHHEPTDTAPLPPVLVELGMPTEAYVEWLFARYAEVTR
jgi:hypothetical protein